MNFLAFSEITEEYHNELYGFIEAEGYFQEFLNGKSTMSYKNNSNGKTEQIILSKYIRHQIHHPENKENNIYTFEQLRDSITEMRDFINTKVGS